MEVSESHFVKVNDNEDCVAVILPFDQRLYLKGKVKLKNVICGGLECFGAKFTPQCDVQNVEIYSPRGYSLLCFQSFKMDSPEQAEIKNAQLRKLAKKFGPSATIFVLQKLDSDWCTMLEQGLRFSDSQRQSMSLFGKDKVGRAINQGVEEQLDVNFAVSESDFQQLRARLYHSSPQWEVAVQNCLRALENQGKVFKVLGIPLCSFRYLKW